MEYNEVMNELEELGTAQTVKIYRNHGADIDLFGVSIANLKKVLRPIKKDRDLGMKLLKSGNVDAIYLSQWIVQPEDLTRLDLEEVLLSTDYYMLIENAIPPIAFKDKDLALDCLTYWIDHEHPRFRQAAYSLYCLMMSSYDDTELDIVDIKNRLEYISLNIHKMENRVRYAMNSFVISAGIYIVSLTEYAKEVAEHIGKVSVNMGKTSCKVPFAPEYILKVEKMNRLGKKHRK